MGGDNGVEVDQRPDVRDEERILVSVRVRPLSEKEMSRNEVVDWECVSDTTIVYKNHSSLERSMYPSSYTFDKVFRWDCSTRQVYEEGARTVVLSAVRGINSSVFAYGQTSSGKTFTMYGITEYTMEDIFDHIQKHKEREFQLKFSAMEIYNESVRDLLTKDNTPLKLLDDPERGTVVERLTEETLRDWDHFKELLAVCEAQRQIGETNLNEVSSRSHQILRLTIESSTREYQGKSNTSTLTATLNFVDLAGSERASQALSAGSRLKEGSHINRSLLTLGTVIRKLSKGRTGHIPYRDSKLTRILQSSLGGNARTAVVCTMSPARSYVEQSRNTLLFASCAKEVTTNAHVNIVISDKILVKHLQKELARLQSELKNTTHLDKDDASDLLREKECIIQQLEGHIRELTLRLDLALSKIHELEQGVEDTRLCTWEGDHSSYPKLHIRPATSDSSHSNRTAVTNRQSFDDRSTAFQTPQSPDRHSRTSYDEIYSISDFDENLPPTIPFERVFIDTPSDASPQIFFHPPPMPNMVDPNYHQNVEGVCNTDSLPNFIEFHPYQVSDEINRCENNKYRKESLEAVREQDDDHSEDDCKEVQCIEIEITNDAQPSSPAVEREENSLALSLTEHENERYVDEVMKQENEIKELDPSKASIVNELEDVNFAKCASDHRTNSMGSTCTFFVEKVMCEIINECGDKGVEYSEGKLSSLKYDTPENEVLNISRVVENDETPMTDIKVLSDIDNAGNSACVTETKEITDSQCVEGLQDHQLVEDTVNETGKSIKIMKDVGLNPQDDLDTIQPWPSDFKIIKEKIINLWHTCSVPLVHRTYFFMLFIKCDPVETIYMEVERRRLSCIQDAFSNGNPIVLEGQKLTLSSSKKALHNERKMLSKEMKKRFTSDERSDLFVKWGIPLNSKDRCFQFANRLWTDTIDMNHITQSANIVAKLVRFSEPRVPKEVFGLNMTTTLTRRKSFSLL